MNIVIFMTDQQSHDTLGCGGNPYVKTPAYDRLARDGVHFTQATCAATPCVPSRFAMFSGYYASQTGVKNNGHLYQDENCIPSFGHVCREQGLTTGVFGKMHFIPYHADVERQDYFGFDRRMGHFYETGERMDNSYPQANPETMDILNQEKIDGGISKGGDACMADMMGYDSTVPANKFPDWWCAEQAASFITEHADQGFATVVSAIAPHAPHVVPSDFKDLCKPDDIVLPAEADDSLSPGPLNNVSKNELAEGLARYYNRVSFVDACHDQVLRALDESGQYDETLIIYCSDHGEMIGSRGHSAFSKYCLYDQAIRVPLIIKPPKSMCHQGQVAELCARPVSLIDVLPTIYDFLGVDQLRIDELSGYSLKPLLESVTSAHERSTTITEFFMHEVYSVAVRDVHNKLIVRDDGSEEFYKIDEDPQEIYNRIDDENCTERIQSMRDGLEKNKQCMGKTFDKASSDFAQREWSTTQTN